MKKNNRFVVALACLLVSCLLVGDGWAAQGPANYLHRPDSWFAGAEAKQVAANILAWQATQGGWPKNADTTTARATGGKPLAPTFDNGATMNEMRFLARIHRATRDASYRAAFERGLAYILNAQYPTGGWPQSYPPDGKYHRYITFNDNAMVNLMKFIREVATDASYDFVNAEQRARARNEFDQGIQCILKCQVKVNGTLTAWCAQHDELDYRPRPARAYELVSLSGAESVGIVRLLMSLEHPDAATVTAIQSAVAWFESVKITGRKVVEVADAKSPKGTDRRLIEDRAAAPIWARFYEIGTNRPMFCDRDGQVKYDLADIGYERRNGYSWLGDWPANLLSKEFPQWQRARGGSHP